MSRKTRMDKIIDEVIAGIERGYDPSCSYDSRLAAINLGICTKTLQRLRDRGIVRAFSVGRPGSKRVSWRYRTEDLDEYYLNHSNKRAHWVPDEDPELPVRIVAQLLGVTTDSVYVLKSTGKLADYGTGQYSKRYDAIWVEFVDRVQAILDPPEPKFGSCPIVFDSLGLPKVSVSDSSGQVQLGPVKVSYRASRLTFKRDFIEPLNGEEIFEVITPVGTYRFTKQHFYAEFPNIPETESYRKLGSYHGKTLHLKAQRFRVVDSVDDRD